MKQLQLPDDPTSARKIISITTFLVIALIISILAVATITPLKGLFAMMVMATDSCHSINPVYDILWAAGFYGLSPLVVASIITVWFAAFKRSVKLLLLGCFIPLLAILLQALALLSLLVLGC